jgi:hypothetical protein
MGVDLARATLLQLLLKLILQRQVYIGYLATFLTNEMVMILSVPIEAAKAAAKGELHHFTRFN